MAYAAFEESVRLLEGQLLPAPALHLSRRVRHLPIAVDREGDVAATMFLRRGVSGVPLLDVHSFERDDSGWRLLGGGSGSASDAFLSRRRSMAQGADLAVSLGGGGTARNAERLMPWGSTWVWWCQLRLAADVATLRVGSRDMPVAPHGITLIVWGARRPPPVVAVDAQAAELGRVALRRR